MLGIEDYELLQEVDSDSQSEVSFNGLFRDYHSSTLHLKGLC